MQDPDLWAQQHVHSPPGATGQHGPGSGQRAAGGRRRTPGRPAAALTCLAQREVVLGVIRAQGRELVCGGRRALGRGALVQGAVLRLPGGNRGRGLGIGPRHAGSARSEAEAQQVAPVVLRGREPLGPRPARPRGRAAPPWGKTARRTVLTEGAEELTTPPPPDPCLRGPWHSALAAWPPPAQRGLSWGRGGRGGSRARA